MTMPRAWNLGAANKSSGLLTSSSVNKRLVDACCFDVVHMPKPRLLGQDVCAPTCKVPLVRFSTPSINSSCNWSCAAHLGVGSLVQPTHHPLAQPMIKTCAHVARLQLLRAPERLHGVRHPALGAAGHCRRDAAGSAAARRGTAHWVSCASGRLG